MKKVLALVLVGALMPFSALAQTPAGKVTVVDGTATNFRPNAAAKQMKLSDTVEVRDTIKTDRESLVKMLMGGKALVTVRELSSLTITEEPNKTLITMAANPPNGGKVAVNLIKGKMKPGESIDVRTPNAIASVRGSLAIVETNAAGTQTDVDNFDGTDVRAAVIVAGVVSAFLQIPAGQGLTITNVLGPLRTIRPNVLAKLQSKTKPGHGQAPKTNVAADVSALGGAGDSNMPGAGDPYGNTRILPGRGENGGYISKP